MAAARGSPALKDDLTRDVVIPGLYSLTVGAIAAKCNSYMLAGKLRKQQRRQDRSVGDRLVKDLRNISYQLERVIAGEYLLVVLGP